jgi:hypothetical protein
LAARQWGWNTTVFERDGVGASLCRWGSTRFFTPLSMNLPPGAAEVLGSKLPPSEALLTGPEFVEHILRPLAESEILSGCVKEGHSVVAIGRDRLTRTDYAGHPLRSERAFRLLVDTPKGESSFVADAVVDASGTYPLLLAVPGERTMCTRCIRNLGDLDSRLGELAGRRLLLVGHGHSAANAILRLADLAARAPRTQVIWATRSLHRRPCVEISPDPLPERLRVVEGANRLASNPPDWLRVERNAWVEQIRGGESSTLDVALSGGREVTVDEIAAFTGYRPDHSWLSELALDIDGPTEGASKLARALRNVTDCLSAPSVGGEDLGSGEPGFYLAGSKSYGRARTFLLRSGYAQLESILRALGRSPTC